MNAFNRRQFIKTAGAGVILISAPFSIKAQNISNAAELTSAIEKMFPCKVGYQGAYITEKISKKYKDLLEKSTSQDYKEREFACKKLNSIDEKIEKYKYFAIAYGIYMDDAQKAEAILCEKMYDDLSAVEHGSLIWRVKPFFESHEVSFYKGIWMTKEMFSDRSKIAYTEDGKEYKLKSSPENCIPHNVEQDLETGHFKYKLKTERLNKLRMRIWMPNAIHLAKIEGAPTRVIK